MQTRKIPQNRIILVHKKPPLDTGLLELIFQFLKEWERLFRGDGEGGMVVVIAWIRRRLCMCVRVGAAYICM